MSKEYIDREALEIELNHRLNFLMAKNGEYDHYTSGFDECVDRVENFPSADAVEVVRCKDCRYREKWNGADLCFNPYYNTAFRIKKNGYCSDGKRREG